MFHSELAARVRRARRQQRPPNQGHGDGCFCTNCEDWYLTRLLPGDLVRPVQDSTSAWALNGQVIWNSYWQREKLGIYIGPVPHDHRMDYVQCGLFLIQGLGLRLARRNRVISILNQ